MHDANAPGSFYDANGNIKYLKRSVNNVVEDALSYSYNGNQLLNIIDTGIASKLFKDKTNAQDYDYDTAGNLKKDLNKDVEIKYNYLNLPGEITRRSLSPAETNNGKIKHYYAGSSKLRMEVYDAAGTGLLKTYDYVAGMVYIKENDTQALDFMATPEGRYLQKTKVYGPTAGQGGVYEYSLKDHLGNLRVACRCNEPKRDATGTIIPTGTAGAGKDALAIVQEIAYDPWGLAFGETSILSTSNQNKVEASKFLYNGKEQIKDLDLGLYEYGFRWYDADNARFVQVDPLANDYAYKSVYDYAENEPISNIDLDGLEKINYQALTSKIVSKNIKNAAESQADILSLKVNASLVGGGGKLSFMGVEIIQAEAKIHEFEFKVNTANKKSFESICSPSLNVYSL